MIFYKDQNGLLWEIPEEDVHLYDKEDVVIVDDDNLPRAFYPFFKINENGDIVPDDDRILEKAKKISSNNIETAFEETIKKGYTCSNGIKLFCSFDDIQKYKAGLELMQKLGNTETYIKDYDGNYHQISVDDLDKMITELGVYYMQNWQKQGNLLSKIKQATTIDELLQIDWNSNA